MRVALCYDLLRFTLCSGICLPSAIPYTISLWNLVPCTWEILPPPHTHLLPTTNYQLPTQKTQIHPPFHRSNIQSNQIRFINPQTLLSPLPPSSQSIQNSTIRPLPLAHNNQPFLCHFPTNKTTLYLPKPKRNNLLLLPSLQIRTISKSLTLPTHDTTNLS